jgi:hypothetical protein
MGAIGSFALLAGGAWTSGVRLYLTVAALGFMGKMGWIALPGDLKIISNPLIFTTAGLVYGIEFFADKIKFVDSIWDSVQTFIRPFGGAALGYLASSGLGPVAQIPVAMLTGAVATTSALTKASARIAINASPEPVSNVVTSTAEDGVSAFVLYMIVKHPVIASIIIIVLIALTVWLLIILFKFVKKIFGWLFRSKSTTSSTPDMGQIK